MSQWPNPRRNTRQHDPGRATASPRPEPESNPLYSWASVEEHLAAHDGEEIQDYADDIDNLLVFAGLFSAILTAFITQTYPSLVPGDMATTNQLLALSIQVHLHSIDTVPETLDPWLISRASAVSTDFAPSAPDRWINIVFFLSLLFSLAAALFGILAKQWLREYMKWNKPLASPRENVLVRQIRFEAWETWRVTAVISSIPILLELGMFLFLAGVVILLWTLDNVVAQVVTVFAAIFTSIICAFTVLPIFSKRCPYRSPTAWAFLAAARAVCAAFDFGCWLFVLSLTFLFETVLYLSACIMGLGKMPLEFELCQDLWHDYIARTNWTAPSTWRDQDLEQCFATTVRIGMWSKPIDLHKAARDELMKEKKRFLREGARGPDEDTSLSTLDLAADALLHNIASASRLLRALSWVRQSAENDLISTYVDQCIASIHSSSLQSTGESLAEWNDQIRMLTDWCLLTSVKDNHRPDQPYRALLGASKVSGGKDGELAEFRRHSGVRVDDKGHLTLLCDRPHLAKTGLSKSFSLLIPSITQLSKADIKHFSAVATRRNGTSEFRAARQRALELFSSLTVSSNILDDEHVWSLLLEATGHRDSENPPVITEISSDLFMLAVRYGKVGLAPNGEGLVLGAGGTMGPQEFEALLDYFTKKLVDPVLNDNYLNLVVLTSFYWLRSGGVSSSGFSAKHTLDKMISAAKTISSPTRPRGSPDRRDYLWISELCFRSYALTVFHGSRFRELLHALGDAYRREQLVGPQEKIHEHLHHALVVAHKERPCEFFLYCPWQKHNCQRIWSTCPLLHKRRGSTFASTPYLSEWSPRARSVTESSGASSPGPARPRKVYLPPIGRVFTRRERRGTVVESPVTDAARPSLETPDGSPSEGSHVDLHTMRPRASSAIRFLDVVSRAVDHADEQGRSAAPAHVRGGADATVVQADGGPGEPAPDAQAAVPPESTPVSPTVDASGPSASPPPPSPPALTATEGVSTPPSPSIYQPPRRSFRDIAARGMRAGGSGVRASGSGVRYAASLFEDAEGEEDNVHSDASVEFDTGQNAGGERTQ